MSEKPSYIRTSNAIMYAFISLLKEKSFEKITVQDILDRTPVTRATFYAHYHDKYEIAERMLQLYLDNRKKVRTLVLQAKSPKQKMYQITGEFNHDLIIALLKVHTEKVDLRRAIVQEFENDYLKESQSPTAQIEAKIFAQARAELEFTIYTDIYNTAMTNSTQILYNVANSLLNLAEHKELRYEK